jgi:hypothetical protein
VALSLDEVTVREARARYFAENGFGEGGYESRFVKLQLGPLPVWIVNTQSRVRSVRLHDVHHVLTGYRTDVLGEGEIGAFELGAGCADHFAAWYLNLNALAIALPLGPRALLRAFARGRRSRCLYEREWDEALLDETVAGLRRRLPVVEPELEPTAAERLGFCGTAAAGAAVFLSHFALLAGLVWLLA